MKEKDIYAWVPWFQSLARKIAEEGREYLIEKAKLVQWKNKRNGAYTLLNYGDHNIDPFSFFYYLAEHNDRNKWTVVFEDVSKVFDIDGKALLSIPKVQKYSPIFPGPTYGNGFPVFFGEDGVGNPDLLWKVFKHAVNGMDNITPEDFQETLEIKNVGVQKLTQCLFLMNPNVFMPTDKGTLKFHDALGLDTFAKADSRLRQQNGLEYYKGMLPKFRDAFPHCKIYEINTALFLLRKWERSKLPIGNKFFQVSANAHGYDESSHWDKFSKWNCVYTGARGKNIPFGSRKIIGKLYPIRTPENGDIVLVRTGWKKGLEGGRAIGVVYENEYAKEELAAHDATHADNAIQVLWLNKAPAKLAENTGIIGFSNAPIGRKAYNAFSNADEYYSTFTLIDYLKERRMKNLYFDKLTLPPENQVTYPHNQILYGPPGTGKTWSTVNHALAIVCGIPIAQLQSKEHPREWLTDFFNVLKQNKRVEMVTFHQSFTYEDFVEGIRPVLGEDDDGSLDYEIVDGVFKRISKQAEDDPDKKYVLIIDEINRGNIAKIFGELITLIESTKRLGNSDEVTVTLPYSGDPFGIPNNLYLIGTMNTADRSIALLDTALRRRFKFVAMMPEPNHALISNDVSGVKCQTLLDVMNQRITALLDCDHQLGHSYLMNLKDIDDIADIFKTQIIPLLQEYFYDDWEKIDLVLNHNGFVTTAAISKNLFFDTKSVNMDRKIYGLIPANSPKWNQPENYQKIYSSNSSKSPNEGGE